ncbi:MAG: hypothetical protein OXG78_09435 [Chloroflexi bacterium]|nr:hypothetical protein [Chloroflexota bacterium]
MSRPKVIHQPETRQALSRGIATLVNAIAPTLGPLPRRSIAQNLDKFELLDDGGVIARRIIALPEQDDDVGAMLMRQVVWKTHQHVGDGAATTALLYEKIYNEGLRFIAAGADPMRLRSRLMALLPALTEQMTADLRQLSNEAELQALAFSICYDEEMAAILAEVLHTLGQYGQVDVREGHGRGMEYNYVEGSYWRGGVQSKEMLRGGHRLVAELHDAAILVTDAAIEEPAELVPVMQLALRTGIKQLLLIVDSISEKGLAVVLDKRLRGKIRTIIVKLDEYHPGDLSLAQEDIALMTGARPLLQKAGESLATVQAPDFGWARWVWADDKNFGFASGKGDPGLVREQVRRLRETYSETDDDDTRMRALNRLGNLNGGLATVYVGGIAKDEIRGRKELAERAIRALRRAADGGVIPGGGVALLRCRDWLLHDAMDQEELESRAARLILAAAAEAPIRTLLENAGYDPSEALAQLGQCAVGSGFDVMTGAIVDMAEAGIVDVAQVQVEAAQRAVASAALALTIDVLVLHREPETMTEP